MVTLWIRKPRVRDSEKTPRLYTWLEIELLEQIEIFKCCTSCSFYSTGLNCLFN